MSLIASRRDRRKHTPDTIIRNLRDENKRLLTRQMAADDYFALLRQDVAVTNEALRKERERREIADRALAQAEEAIRLRDREIADLRRKLDVGVKAEHVIAETQELSAEEVRRHCVMPLGQAREAGLLGPVTDPGRTTT